MISLFGKYKYLNIYFALILLVIFSYSCSSTNGGEVDESQSKAVLLSPGELKEKINGHSSKLTSLDCEGDLNIDSPELNSSGSITLSVFKPDSIYSKIEGPFGISIAQFLFTRNNFIYYNIRENTVYKGSSTQLNIGVLLKIKLNFDDLISGYSSSFCFKDTSSVNAEVSKDKEMYVLKITEQDQYRKYWVNPRYYYVEKYGIYDNSGNTKLLIEYADFEPYNNVYTPNNIYISNPSEKQNLWISYGKKIFNKNMLKFKLKIPKSAKIIIWD
jgi:outer membrane lipoprotein-sorting protein